MYGARSWGWWMDLVALSYKIPQPSLGLAYGEMTSRAKDMAISRGDNTSFLFSEFWEYNLVGIG